MSRDVLMLEIERQAVLAQVPQIPKQGLSMERSEIVDKLEGRLRMQFFKHSAKIMLYPHNSLVDHWTDEMASFLIWVQYTTLKPKNKPIDKGLIEYTFFNLCDSMETFEALLNNVEGEYGDKREQRDTKELYNKFNEFKKAVINEIEKKTLKNNTMKQLINQYLR